MSFNRFIENLNNCFIQVDLSLIAQQQTCARYVDPRGYRGGGIPKIFRRGV